MKYKITNISKTIKHPSTNKDVILFQIESLIDFTLINGKEIKVGDKGGWIESEKNLSQIDRCWIYENCMMFDKAFRDSNSIGYGHSKQYGNSQQSGCSIQYGESQQYDDSRQYGNSQQSGESRQYGYSKQYGNSKQFGESKQFGSSRQFGESRQSGNSRQLGNSMQSGESRQFENSMQSGESRQSYKSKQKGDFKHSYGYHLSSSNSGKLTSENELIEFSSVGVGLHSRCINYDKTTKLINVNNCFIGNVDEFESEVKRKYANINSNYYDIIK